MSTQVFKYFRSRRFLTFFFFKIEYSVETWLTARSQTLSFILKPGKYAFKFKAFYTYNFSCDFLLLTDVNEWIDKKCSVCRISHPNFFNWFSLSHPPKEENYGRWGKCVNKLLCYASSELR